MEKNNDVFNQLLSHYYEALRVLQTYIFERLIDKKSKLQPGLIISMINPGEKYEGFVFRNHIIRFEVFEGAGMPACFAETLIIDNNVDTNETLKEFIKFVMKYNKVIEVSQLLGEETPIESRNDIPMDICIYFSENIIINTPKDDFEYSDILLEANNQAIIYNPGLEACIKARSEIVRKRTQK